MSKKNMYTIWTEDEGRAKWVTKSKKKAQGEVDQWYEDFYEKFGYKDAEEFKNNCGYAYVLEVEVI
jgi:hypothetical protein